MSENVSRRAWYIYLLLGVLVSSGYFFAPSIAMRELLYNVVDNVAGLAASAAILIGTRMYRPIRALPWYLFVVGLLLLVSGDILVTVNEFLGRKLPFPTPADGAYLASYPFMIAGILMIGRSRVARTGPAGIIDPLIVATGFGLLFWVYFMEPYIIEVYADHPSLTPLSVLIALAYPLMDLVLLLVLIRTLVISSNRPVSYYLLGASLCALLASDIVWTVAQSIGSRQIVDLVDLGFLLFFSLFGAAALHPSMSTLFEPVPKVESRLTRLRLALLAGASLMAPAVLALQAVRGEPVNAALFVAVSATLFLLVVARMANMMRARERAADRERALRQAGAALAASQSKQDVHEATIDAALNLLGPEPAVGVSLWEGTDEEMQETITTGEERSARFGVQDLPEETRKRFLEGRSVNLDESQLTCAPEPICRGPRTHEVFLVPLRARGDTTGALMVAGRVPLTRESKDALEALGNEVALALENLQLLDEVRRTSVLKERQRLSHEIHDTLAQGFTSIVVSLSAAQLAHPEMFSDSAPAQRHLELARRTARETLGETRRLVWALRPEALDRHPLPQALDRLVEEWSGRTGTKTHFSVSGTLSQLLPETEVTLLRVAQEALANIHKHAGAEQVVLTLSYLDDLVALDVVDDGVGFDANSTETDISPQDTGGFGLVAMRERVEQLQGNLSVESVPKGGTTLAVALPVSPAPPHTNQRNSGRRAVEETR